ncbi:MAG: protein translocase subunit SecD [Actinobacteria bacterium]|nr:protein translocase subunit SecD [Actinomycetota bacterium]
MTKKSGALPLVLTTVLSIGACIAVLIAGWSPVLGLDLQGGVSVVLEPRTEDDSTITKESLEQTRAIIQKRVDKVGVAEPEISIQGNNIVVELPGAKDQRQVLDQVGRTAELRFRPVLAPPVSTEVPEGAEDDIAELRAKLNIPEGVTAEQIYNETLGLGQNAGATDGIVAEGDSQIIVDDSTTGSTPTSAPAGDATGEGTGGGQKAPLQTTAAPTTAAPADAADPATTTIPEVPTNQYGVDISSEDFGKLYQLEAAVNADVNQPVTAPEDDKADQPVTLLSAPDADGVQYKYSLGPTLVTGKSIEDATASLYNGQWVVLPTFRAGAQGIDLFNQAASLCYSGAETCPGVLGAQGALAVVLDGEVLSAPTINAPSFGRSDINISGDFDQEEAKILADALKFGSLPLTLDPQTVQTVSATLGEGALRSGIIAGLIGLAVVVVYMIAYYRLLGLITIGALVVTGSVLWAVVGVLGEQQGLALTLAGIVGIVVSVGVSLDSSIVYFENLKEDVAAGKNFRRAVEESFSQAWGTIVKADVSQLIGAVILYFLSTGAVRGFAFYLALSTLIDLLLAYVFIRPATLLAVRSRLGDSPSRFGVPVPPTVDQVKGGVLS